MRLPRSYDEAREIEGRHTSRWSGRVGNNTYLNRTGHTSITHPRDAYAVRLHRTDVVTFYPDGRIRLDSDGWATVTTRDRIKHCGIPIGTCGGVASIDHGGRSWTYADRMILHPDGRVEYAQPYVNPDPVSVLRERRRNLRAGSAVPCGGRTSNHWRGGNVPEAFERPEPPKPRAPSVKLAQRLARKRAETFWH